MIAAPTYIGFHNVVAGIEQKRCKVEPSRDIVVGGHVYRIGPSGFQYQDGLLTWRNGKICATYTSTVDEPNVYVKFKVVVKLHTDDWTRGNVVHGEA